MKAVILCGGRGTRLREVAETIPKPMVPIGGMPIIWHIMKTYAAHGIDEFVLLLGYKGQVIRDFFVNFALSSADVTVDLSRTDAGRLTFHSTVREPWRVTLVETGEETMTGARIRRARPYLEEVDRFCLTYGDGVGDIDISALLSFHEKHGCVATLTGVFPPGRFGELTVTDGRIEAFNEKPQVAGGYINGGFFVLENTFVDRYLDDDPGLVLERQPLEACAADGQLMMYRHDGFWQPMDTPREYQLLNDLWTRDVAPWKVW